MPDQLQSKYINPSSPTRETGVFRQSGAGAEVSLDVLINPGSMCVIETTAKPASSYFVFVVFPYAAQCCVSIIFSINP